MRFEARQPVEDQHLDDIHPLSEFAWLLGGALVCVLIAVSLIGYFAGELAARLPFQIESDFAAPISAHLDAAELSEDALAIQTQLRALGAEISRDMDLPPDLLPRIHYRDETTLNAMATLGGNVIIYRGLLEKLPNEDALSMVLAHEIAHLRLRHPIIGAGRGVAIGLSLSALNLSGTAGAWLSSAGALPLLQYSRDQERAADAAAFDVLAKRYGHLRGGEDLFALFQREQAESGADSRIAFMQTHPLSADRLASTQHAAAAHKLPLAGTPQPLSGAILALHQAAQGEAQKNSVSAPVKP